ncbi:hypothetical protein D3C76_1765000 [compost metagenome]
MLGAQRHGAGPRGDESRGGVRRGDDDFLALRDHLVHVKGDIARARRKIKQQIIQLAPPNVAEKLPKHFS